MDFFLETYTVAGYVSQRTANTSKQDLTSYFMKTRGLLTCESLANAKNRAGTSPMESSF